MNKGLKNRRFRLTKLEWFIYHFALSILNCTLFVFYYSDLHAQSPTREQMIGTWIGVHSEWDSGFVCPLPTYIQLDADSTYRLGMVDGSASPLISTWSVQEDSLRLDTIHYTPRMVSVQNNLLHIGTLYPMVFRRFNSTPIDSASAYQQLKGNVWQSDSLIISLYADGRANLENRTNKQRTAHFWQIVRFNQSLFLVVRGNQYSRNGNYKPLWQISSLSPKQMKAIGWNGCDIATETFRFIKNLAPGDSCKLSGFQPCDNCFRAMWYEKSFTNAQERYNLEQLLNKYYQPIYLPGESGLIRVQFVVNCEGERALFRTAGFGLDYCPRNFNERIINQLLAICRDHLAADPALRQSNRSNTSPLDVAVSLTFRLKDGQLTDILP
jgi:hypothetical protein